VLKSVRSETESKDISEIKLILESLLFVATEAIAVSRLADVAGVSPAEVESALRELEADYQQRGFRLQRHRDMVQLVSAPEMASYVEKFLGLDLTTKLSAAALETLGIIAYRQPVTRAQIEAIRGVNCDGVLRTLLNFGLIEECGRLEQAGRPILYGTTFQFLQYFGLSRHDELPPLEEIAGQDPPDSSADAERDESVKYLKS